MVFFFNNITTHRRFLISTLNRFRSRSIRKLVVHHADYTHVCKGPVRRRGDEYDQGRELGRPEDLKRLRLDVQYGDLAFLVDFPDRVQLRAVHGVVVGAYLTPVRRVCRSARSRPKTAETAANDSAERRDTNGLKGQRRAGGVKNKRRASLHFTVGRRGTRGAQRRGRGVNDPNVLRAWRVRHCVSWLLRQFRKTVKAVYFHARKYRIQENAARLTPSYTTPTDRFF